MTATRLWPTVLADCVAGTPATVYDGGQGRGRAVHRRALGPAAARPLHVGIGADRARVSEALLVLLGLAHRRAGAAHASGASAWCEEIVELRRRGFRFIALADDNFYPVTLDDLGHGGAAGRPALARAS